MAESLRFDIFAIDRASHVFDKVGEHSEAMGSKLGRVGKVAAVGLSAIAAGVGAVAVGMGLGLKAASDYQRITNQTNAVLKSTKGAAGESAAGIKELAEKVSGYSGISRDAVQGGENLLLTFTNIHDKVGKGNDIFTRATKTLADMTTALGEDPKNAAIQLGKALNDPVKGMTALRRVGVSFSQGQIDTVKHLEKTGHTMAAQKIILGELNKEFGGSAKAAGATFSGSMEKLKNSLMDVVVDGLTPLLPLLTKGADWLAAKLPVAIDFLSSKFDSFKGSLGGASSTVSKVTGVLSELWGWVQQKLLPAFENAGKEVLPAVGAALKGLGAGLQRATPLFKTMGIILTALVIPVLGKVATIIWTVLGPAFKIIGTILGKIVAPALKFIITIFLDLVSVILNGAAKAFGWIPGIGGKLKKAAKDFQTFKDGVNDQLNGIKKKVNVNFTATIDANMRKAMALGGQPGARAAQSVHGEMSAALYGGHKAGGGPVKAGFAYTVNEIGQETFIPSVNGTIRPHGAAGATTININVSHNGIGRGPNDDLKLAREIEVVLARLYRSRGRLQFGTI